MVGRPAPAAARTERDTAAVTIELLGGFRVQVGTRPVEDGAWRLQKARGLVKLLALAAGHRLPRDRVVDLLWPEFDPDAVNNNLYQTLHCVRRALRLPGGEPAVSLRQGLVSLLPQGNLWVDVDAFDAAARAARGSDDIALYRAALALYSGELLPDDLYDDWATWRREGLKETYLSLFLTLAKRHEARGELKEAMDVLGQAVQVDPLCEEAHTELMRLYASTGQRGRALKQFQQLRAVLAAELDVEPDEDNLKTYQAIVAGQFGDTGAIAAGEVPPAPRHNLPLALTSFVGRQSERQEIRALLADTRLLTLTGVGGAGKTRLALRVAWDLLDSYRDGVWLVQLSSLSDPRLLPGLLAGILGVEDKGDRLLLDRIVETLRDRRSLLILDNCEHLLDACRALNLRLLAGCPQLQLIATSRARLGVPGEMTFPVSPLSHPADPDASVEELAASEAAQLFVERARFRQPSFALTPQTASGIHRICSFVEGIPLALELAASRAGVLGVNQIADRLTQSGRLLATTDQGADARHRSLAAALDWSYALLDPAERGLFRRLAVFRGGWTVEAAALLHASSARRAARSSGADTTLELLSRLVDKSLVVVEGAAEGTVRYRLLEPVRQYAWERLQATGEEEEIRRRHALAYASFAEEAGSQLRGAQAHTWVHRLEADHANIRAAVRWSIEKACPETGLRIAGAFWRFWYNRGYLNEGRELTRQLLALGGEAPEISVAIRAAAFNAAGAMAFYQTDTVEALASYQRALALRREIGDRSAEAKILSNIGLVLKDQGERERAAQHFARSLDLCRELNDTRGLCSALGNLGILYQEQGDFARARPLHEESLALAHALGDTPMTTLNNLGALAVEEGEYARARRLLEESLAISVKLGVKRTQCAALINLGHVARGEGTPAEAIERYRAALATLREQGETALDANGLEGMAGALADTGDARTAAILLTVAARVRQACGTPLSPVERTRVASILSGVRAGLGSDFEAVRATAASTSLEDAVALALYSPNALEV